MKKKIKKATMKPKGIRFNDEALINIESDVDENNNFSDVVRKIVGEHYRKKNRKK